MLISFLKVFWYSRLRFTRLLGAPPEYKGKWRAWTSTVVMPQRNVLSSVLVCELPGVCPGLINTLVTLMKPITWMILHLV